MGPKPIVPLTVADQRPRGRRQTFEYRVFDTAPGGHGFERMDTPKAREIRRDVYRSLARYLKPPHLQG
jgi:hypothetical protein